MSADSSAGLLVVLVLIVVNAILSAAHAALVNVHRQHLHELADKGDKRAKRVLDISEDATRLLTSRQFVGIILRYAAAGILTLVFGLPFILWLETLGLAPNTAVVVGYAIIWIAGALVMLPEEFVMMHRNAVPAAATPGTLSVRLAVLEPL